MSRWGVIRFAISNNPNPEDFFGRPDYWMIPQVVNTGDLFKHPEVNHPPRHFFESSELKAMLQSAGLENHLHDQWVGHELVCQRGQGSVGDAALSHRH